MVQIVWIFDRFTHQSVYTVHLTFIWISYEQYTSSSEYFVFGQRHLQIGWCVLYITSDTFCLVVSIIGICCVYGIFITHQSILLFIWCLYGFHMNSIHTLVSILFWTQAPAHWRLLHITLDTFYLWWIQLGKLQNLRDGWAAANGIPYESRKSPYFRLIFTQHTIWPLRNPKISWRLNSSTPLMTLYIFCPPPFGSR